MKIKNKITNPQSGYATLISILFVSIIGLTISVSLLLLGTEALKGSLAIQQSDQARSLASACAEESLNKLRKDFNYSGNETILFEQGTCQILVLSGSGSARTIKTKGTVGNVIRKLKIEVNQLQPSLGIASWKEVADF